MSKIVERAIPKEFIPSIKNGLNQWSGPRISNDKNKTTLLMEIFIV